MPGVDAFDVYRALRIVNPSPYMYFLRFGLEPALEAGFSPQAAPRQATVFQRRAAHSEASHSTAAAGAVQPLKSGKKAKKHKKAKKPKPVLAHIVGSSPELLVRVHGRTVEYRPIAGTRPRSADEVEDRALEADLRADEKEVAEHVMLVDLGRNDVGRVSEYGSVKVKDLMFVERYSHVMHLVSSLEGTLKPELEAIDAFRACFPAGTLSGAPKIRAMEIIEELEPARRGVYGGVDFVCGLLRQSRLVHRHSHALHERRAGAYPGGRGHRGGFGAGERICRSAPTRPARWCGPSSAHANHSPRREAT